MFPGSPGVPTAPAPDSVVVEGFVAGVEAKQNGRFSITIKKDATEQYGTKLNTKDVTIAQDLTNRMGQFLRFQCGISNWTMADGTPVASKWINQYSPLGQDFTPAAAPVPPVGVGATLSPMAPAAAPAPAPAPSSRSRFPFKDETIAFQAMAKGLPTECFKLLPADQQTLENAIRIARHWAAEALQIGAQGLTAPTAPTPPAAPLAEDDFDRPPPPGDDDIPF